MPAQTLAYTGAHVFDGETFRNGHAVIVEDALIAGIVPDADLPVGAEAIDLEGGLLCPGFVDLQVNGGGGVMLNDAPNSKTLQTMADAHLRLGVTSFLPTLITDTPERTRAAIEAVAESSVVGVAGLHLEGPHLAVAKKGAHSAALIRPMTDTDLTLYVAAASRLPRLKLTVAPEAVTSDQIEALSQAGVLIALGHSDAHFEEANAAIAAGASIVTHLFNAMSQLGSRAPGLVGAALENGRVSAGLIADGVHVHPASVRAAVVAKQEPGRIFLVSDAMAVAGTGLSEFSLNGRKIRRDNGRLTLDDGTLAGADHNLLAGVRNLVAWGVVPLDQALAMATSVPGAFLAPNLGRITPGSTADMIHISEDLCEINGIWRSGSKIG